MQFLNLDGSTTGKGEQVITKALNGVGLQQRKRDSAGKKRGQHWEMPT